MSYLVRKDRKEVLLIERLSSSTGLGVNRIAGIGGKLEAGETPDEALKREIYEETKLNITRFKSVGKVKFLFSHNIKWNQSVTVYIGTDWNGEPIETEEARPSWFQISEIPFDRMFTDNQYWVPQVLEGKRVEAIFLYDENHRIQESRIEFF